jgi:hypothetical protein
MRLLWVMIARCDRRRDGRPWRSRTRVRGGLIGDVGFARNGDPDPGLVTILRITSGRGSGDLATTEGSVVERVTKVPPDGF